MAHQDPHLADLDLIMAADGELPEGRRAAVAAHLDGCWSCRERLHALGVSFADFVQARELEMADRLLERDAPATRFRARLAEAASDRPRTAASRWHLVPAAAICSVLALAMMVVLGTRANAEGVKPKAGLTPGETHPVTLAEVCGNPDADVIAANIPEETRTKVFSAYGIEGNRENFEVDYLITPDLGGTGSIRNLWPQPYGAKWNARQKDKLEQRLHQLVCEGKIDMRTAQHDIAADWIGAYKKYVAADL